MRLGIAARLSLLLAMVGVLAAGLTGLYAYRESRTLLVDAAKQKLLTSTQVLARRITLTREEISRTLQMLVRHPAALAVLEKGQAADRAQVATLFRATMETHPSYLQLRLVSAADHGMEQVRIDRHGQALVEVTGDALQEKGHLPYVADALQLPAETTYLSRITINHETGSHASLDQPVFQLAMPVVPERGGALGVLVVNVDLEGMFSLLAADLPAAFRLFLANGDGDILIHPDAGRTFGFDKGRRFLVQDEFPPTAPLVAGTGDEAVFETGRNATPPLVAAFIGQQVRGVSSETRLVLGLAQPLDQVLAEANGLGVTIAQMVLGVCVACLLLAIPLARAFSRPINAMNAAARAYATGQALTGLPLTRKDEIGSLARSFAQMQALISEQLAALKLKQGELEHLARHDALTGLPNRRLLEERLAQSLARLRRHGGEVGLLFIDLDDFKRVNDDMGHEAGDQVLRAIAERLRRRVREVDTVARLGGDEFVVLVDAAPPPAQMATLAQGLVEAIQAPIPLAGASVTIGASVGIGRAPQDGQTAAELMAHADRAMYDAKPRGRGGQGPASPGSG